MERICPSCDKPIQYKTYKVFWKACKNNSTCRMCFYTSLKGVPRDEITKQKIGRSNSIALKGNIPSNKGVPMSTEQKEKCRVAHIGKKLSAEHVHNIMVGIEKVRFQRKSYTLPNGKTVYLQGYENLTLDKLFSEQVSCEEIRLKTSEKPVIPYKMNGKQHRYYPDCFIPNKNTLVETKSSYTWKVDMEENMEKIKSSQASGYDVRLLIWDSKKTLVSDTLYPGGIYGT